MNEIDKLKQRAGIPLKENEFQSDPAELVAIVKSHVNNSEMSDDQFRSYLRNIITAF